MYFSKSPAWINEFEYPYQKFEDIPQEVFDKINANLDAAQSNDPQVTIVITAWNEEVNILKCVASLSKMTSLDGFEILVINNNSTDKTQNTIDKLHIRSLFQPIQGCGPSRQSGQENARGKYILSADADCFYPMAWVDEMMKILKRPGTVCVYGRYSFISEPGFPRWQLYFFEKLKDLMAEYRHFKRPYLNTFGLNMGFVKEYGLKVGIVMTDVRGDDGRLAFDLMSYGKIKQVKSDGARAWTGPRTLQRDGSLISALKVRLKKELQSFLSYLKPHPPHDTKTSENS
jgi:glycosyltransferase involved in cell wall biosynthesis